MKAMGLSLVAVGCCRALVLFQEVSLMLRSYWKTFLSVLVLLAVIWYLLNVQYGSLPAFRIPL